MKTEEKARIYIVLAAVFLATNGYVRVNPMIPQVIQPLLDSITLIATVGSFIMGFVNYISNFGHNWMRENVVTPVRSSVNLMILAASDKDIWEIKKRIAALSEDMKRDKSFWEEFFG